MTACLYQNFFSFLYDYFQTNMIINHISTSQFYSQFSFLVSPFFSGEQDILLLPGSLVQLDLEAGTTRPCLQLSHSAFEPRALPAAWGLDTGRIIWLPRAVSCGLISLSGLGKSPFPPTTLLRSCLM